MMNFPMGENHSAEQLIEQYEQLDGGQQENFHRQILMKTAQFIGMLTDHGYDLHVPRETLQEDFYALAQYHSDLQGKLEQIST